jgi:putative glycerol-1-phosphate prenyltransferase
MIYHQLKESSKEGLKKFAVLIDPDKYDENKLMDLVNIANRSEVHYFFVGGSLMTSSRFEQAIKILKSTSDIPVIIFPGSNVQISQEADAILLLSLISGRNPEYLIGQHVVAAPYLKESGLEILPTGYMLIEGSNNTTANYMSNSLPIPYDKNDIATCTSMAGEMLGMKLIYMDGGSGAGKTISASMIKSVKSQIDIPLIVGGGITNSTEAGEVWTAGADLIVVGNAIEEDLSIMTSISDQLKTTT